MGLWGIFRLLGLEGPDIFAFFVCDILGFVAGFFLPRAWSPYDSVLISFNLFLAWLLFNSKSKTGLSLSILTTVLTHAASLALVVGLVVVCADLDFGFADYALAGLAVFERYWLFSGNKNITKDKPLPVSKEKAAQKAAAVANAITASVTVDDYQDWLKYLAQPNRPPRKPGVSVQDEYKQWLLARARAKVAPPPKS